jgi:hypothetical protein
MTAAYVNKVKNGTNGAQPHQDFNMSNIFQLSISSSQEKLLGQ